MINTCTIAGIEFEAVRQTKPIKHWLPREIKTGTLIPSGYFDQTTRRAMWDSMKHMARRIGENRFREEWGRYLEENKQ